VNKRIYYILLPILALLVCSYGMLYHAVSVARTSAAESFITIAPEQKLPFSSDLKKQEKKIDINAMRIKAKHDVVAINIPTFWEPPVAFVYHTKPYNSFYCVYELCAFHAGYHLRGPPALA